jgi:hypothetical protein
VVVTRSRGGRHRDLNETRLLCEHPNDATKQELGFPHRLSAGMVPSSGNWGRARKLGILTAAVELGEDGRQGRRDRILEAFGAVLSARFLGLARKDAAAEHPRRRHYDSHDRLDQHYERAFLA